MPRKKSSSPGIITFRISLSRSNPLVVREITIPDTYNFKDFTDSVCIAFGLPFTDAELKSDAGAGDIVKDIFSDTYRAELLLPAENGKKPVAQLTFFVDRIEAEAPADPQIPCISYALGSNLPKNLWDVRDVDSVLSEFDSGVVSATAGNTEYYLHDLEYAAGKTENAFRKRFAPQTAQREVNTSVTLPMRQLMNLNKLDVLKDICSAYGIYVYAGTRKAEIVERICNAFDRDRIQMLIKRMNIREYLSFREYLLDEEDTRFDPAVEIKMPRLLDMGLITYTAEKGFCMASELAEFFEEIYDTPKEEEMIKNKYLTTAANVCSLLYGIFDDKMFNAVLDVLGADCISSDERNRAYNRLGSAVDIQWFTRLDGSSYCYNRRKYGTEVLEEIRARRGEGAGFFIPDDAMIDSILKHGIELGKKNRSELAQLIVKYRYFNHYRESEIPETLFEVADSIHWGESAERTEAIAVSAMARLTGWGCSQSVVREVKEKIRSLIERETVNMPLVGLSGFSLNNCPSEMKEHYLKLKDEQETEAKKREFYRRGRLQGKRG